MYLLYVLVCMPIECESSSHSHDPCSFSALAGAPPSTLCGACRVARDPQQYAQYVGVVSQRMLLYGPPGSGKTTLGKEFAKAIGAHAALISMGTIMNSFIGGGAQKIIEAFDAAEKIATARAEPLVIILDEVDAIARKREEHNVHPELANALVALIYCLDRLAQRADVHIICTTNMLGILDTAFLDRFTKIPIELPSAHAREQFFIARCKSMENNGALALTPETAKILAQKTEGLSFRDLAEIFSDAVYERINANNHAQFDPAALIQHVESKLKKRSIEHAWTWGGGTKKAWSVFTAALATTRDAITTIAGGITIYKEWEEKSKNA